MSDDGVTLSVAELVEYCRTQAGLLSGRVETLGGEADALLDEIDEDIAAIRARLQDHQRGTDGPTASPPSAGPEAAEVTELEELERDLEEKQAVAEAKRARMQAFHGLAADYLELAEELDATVEDGREALERVVRFEHDRDAPAYFDDRLTVLEAAAESDDSSPE